MAEDIPPLSRRFGLLLEGIPILLKEKIGLTWLLGLIALNLVILNFQLGPKNKWITSAKWVLVFTLVYVFLLPFGGYRPYRPYIIRFDTVMPVTLALIWLFGATSYQIIATNFSKWRMAYYFVIIYSLVYFTQYDKLGDPAYDCERNMLLEIASSPDHIVKLSEPCSVIDWQTITDYRKSENQAELLLHWNVTSEKKLYYFEAGSKN